MQGDGEITPDIVRKLREIRRISVRYGRARLTVARCGGLTDGKLGAAIERFEQAQLDAEGLAWAFVSDRVVDHTPSFSWEGADLALLLDRIVAVSTDPKFHGSSIDEVAEALVEAALTKREAREESRKRAQRWASGLSGQFGLGEMMRPMVARMNVNFAIGWAGRLNYKGVLGVDPKIRDIAVGGFGRDLRKASEIAPKMRFSSALLADHFAATQRQRFSINPWRDALQEFSAATAISKAMRAYGEPPWLGGLNDRLSEITKPWIERLKESYPANWRELTGEEVEQVVRLMLDPGLCLAWVPRPSILRELVAAEGDEARTAVLEQRSDDIVDDVYVVLGEVTNPKLLLTVDATGKAIAAHRDGHTEAALALASAALSNIVHDYLEEKSFEPVRKVFGVVDPRNDVGFQDFPLYIVGKVWVKVNERFEGNPDPGFNRNRTLHLLGPHYSEPNLLAVLMLLAGLCREFQRFEARNESREDEEATEQIAA